MNWNLGKIIFNPWCIKGGKNLNDVIHSFSKISTFLKKSFDLHFPRPSFYSILTYLFLFFYLRFTPRKAEQPLGDIELQEKEEKQNE